MGLIMSDYSMWLAREEQLLLSVNHKFQITTRGGGSFSQFV